MTIGLLVSIVIICLSLSIPASFVLRDYFLSKKPPTPDEAFLIEMKKELEQKELDLQMQSDKIAATHHALEQHRKELDQERLAFSRRKKQLDERERYLSEGAYQIFLDYVNDSVLTREYLLITPAFQTLIDPDYTNERYSRSLRDMEASIWIEEPFDVTAIVRDESGRHHTTLHHCDCDFYQRFHHPCTHMIRLALEVGGAMCFAPSDEIAAEVKLSKYSPWGNKIWVPIKKKPQKVNRSVSESYTCPSKKAPDRTHLLVETEDGKTLGIYMDELNRLSDLPNVEPDPDRKDRVVKSLLNRLYDSEN